MDEFYESFALNPLYEDPSLIITESIDVDAWITEEAKGTKKKNLFQKIWSILKKLWRMIVVKCKEILNAFVSIFHTKKVNDKTLDQIAEYVLGETEDVPESKHMRFRYDNDQRITMNYAVNTLKKVVGGQPAVPGHDKNDRPHLQGVVMIFHIIKKPYLLDPLMDMMKSVKDNKGQITFDTKRAQAAIDSLWAGTVVGASCTISMEEWTILNDRIVKFHEILQVIDDDTMGIVTMDVNGQGLTEEYGKIINQIAQIAKIMQYGINTIGDGMRQIYELDPKYHNKINSSNFREKLPLFVKMCVEGNVPSKYVHYAVRQISDVSINASPKDPNTKADDKKTLTGNGRFVIFPGDPSLQQYVIKVGYNGLGVRGNRNEFMVWNKVKDIPEIANQLYQIEDINDKDNYVILCQRADPIDHWDGASEWNVQMRELCLKHNVGFIIRCNDGGFAKRKDGSVVCVDYGTVHRIDQ